MVDESGIRERWRIVEDALDERGRRMWAAAEARSHGRGGIAAVVRATGISESTVRRGLAEVVEGDRVPSGRVRRAGGGRRRIAEREPGVEQELLSLLDGVTAGDPMSPLLWTTLTPEHLAQKLRERGFAVHQSTVRRMLRAMGFTLQANRKTREGSDHPDRNAQFEHIAAVTGAALAASEPVISVDTKKKELIGSYKNAGRELRSGGRPILVNTHDFPDEEQGKAVPYGVYDVATNEGYVSVGISGDTAQFSVASIRAWWAHLGRQRYPNATTLTITADAGGSNSYRVRLWKTELQNLADETGLRITVCHFPPATSKWNKIEHRLFSYISIDWRAKPLISRQVVIDLIAATTTSTGLKVYARLDENDYPTKIKISDQQLAAVQIERDEFHPEWNYTIIPSVEKK
ncbi:MAG: ISAzo13 family transposase [Solirubrobacteraceae bacterium]